MNDKEDSIENTLLEALKMLEEEHPVERKDLWIPCKKHAQSIPKFLFPNTDPEPEGVIRPDRCKLCYLLL